MDGIFQENLLKNKLPVVIEENFIHILMCLRFLLLAF